MPRTLEQVHFADETLRRVNYTETPTRRKGVVEGKEDEKLIDMS